MAVKNSTSARVLRQAIDAEAWRLARLQAVVALAGHGAENIEFDGPDGNLCFREVFDHLTLEIEAVKARLFELAEKARRQPPVPKHQPPRLAVVGPDLAP